MSEECVIFYSDESQILNLPKEKVKTVKTESNSMSNLTPLKVSTIEGKKSKELWYNYDGSETPSVRSVLKEEKEEEENLQFDEIEAVRQGEEEKLRTPNLEDGKFVNVHNFIKGFLYSHVFMTNSVGDEKLLSDHEFDSQRLSKIFGF